MPNLYLRYSIIHNKRIHYDINYSYLDIFCFFNKIRSLHFHFDKSVKLITDDAMLQKALITNNSFIAIYKRHKNF